MHLGTVGVSGPGSPFQGAADFLAPEGEKGSPLPPHPVVDLSVQQREKYLQPIAEQE